WPDRWQPPAPHRRPDDRRDRQRDAATRRPLLLPRVEHLPWRCQRSATVGRWVGVARFRLAMSLAHDTSPHVAVIDGGGPTIVGPRGGRWRRMRKAAVGRLRRSAAANWYLYVGVALLAFFVRLTPLLLAGG